MLLFLNTANIFPMQDIEVEEFVYLSIKNETERTLECFDRDFYSPGRRGWGQSIFIWYFYCDC